MTKWKHELIGVKSIVLRYGHGPDHGGHEGDIKDPAVIAKQLHDRLHDEPCMKQFEDQCYTSVDDLLSMERIEEVEDWLDQFYNFCDEHRIWVGE